MSLQPWLTQTYEIYLSTSPCLLLCLLHCWSLLVFHQKRLSSLQLSYFPSHVSPAHCLAACLPLRSEQSCWSLLALPVAWHPSSTHLAPGSCGCQHEPCFPALLGAKQGCVWMSAGGWGSCSEPQTTLKYWERSEGRNLLYCNFRKQQTNSRHTELPLSEQLTQTQQALWAVQL